MHIPEITAYGSPKEVNWKKLQEHLGTSEEKPFPIHGPNPEGIVHELCHAYDCIGEEAFLEPIGEQEQVNDLVEEKYPQPDKEFEPEEYKDWLYAWYLHEIKVTAISFLILEPLGKSELVNMLQLLHGNVGDGNIFSDPEKVDAQFLYLLKEDDVKHQAEKIREFILKFQIKRKRG